MVSSALTNVAGFSSLRLNQYFTMKATLSTFWITFNRSFALLLNLSKLLLSASSRKIFSFRSILYLLPMNIVWWGWYRVVALPFWTSCLSDWYPQVPLAIISSFCLYCRIISSFSFSETCSSWRGRLFLAC